MSYTLPYTLTSSLTRRYTTTHCGTQRVIKHRKPRLVSEFTGYWVSYTKNRARKRPVARKTRIMTQISLFACQTRKMLLLVLLVELEETSSQKVWVRRIDHVILCNYHYTMPVLVLRASSCTLSFHTQAAVTVVTRAPLRLLWLILIHLPRGGRAFYLNFAVAKLNSLISNIIPSLP